MFMKKNKVTKARFCKIKTSCIIENRHSSYLKKKCYYLFLIVLKWTRTIDPKVFSLVLYQLSY